MKIALLLIIPIVCARMHAHTCIWRLYYDGLTKRQVLFGIQDLLGEVMEGISISSVMTLSEKEEFTPSEIWVQPL